MNPLHTLDDDELAAVGRRALKALPDVPAALQQSALALFQAAPSPLGAAVKSGLRLLRAVLSFDSWAQPATAMGMRSAQADTRHLLYSVEGRDIDLRIAPSGASWALAGQILGPDDAGVVELASSCGAAPRQTALDDLGEFRIEGIASGSYVVTLKLSGDEILLPTLEVGPAVR